MKENISTTQEVINVKLIEINSTDFLIFEIINDKYPNGITVNLNDEEGKNDFVNLFSVLLKTLTDKLITFRLVIDENYTKGLFIDVSKEYISALNQEIERVYAYIEKETEE